VSNVPGSLFCLYSLTRETARETLGAFTLADGALMPTTRHRGEHARFRWITFIATALAAKAAIPATIRRFRWNEVAVRRQID
jgi:hypothetical protein